MVRSRRSFRSSIVLRACRGLASLAALGAFMSGSNPAQAGPRPAAPARAVAAARSIDEVIAAASQRFGVPASWIVEVMSVESRARADALSPKGAIGLMQVMPDTYAAMRARYGLGANPWDPRDNVLAGTAYLRLLYDRYGAPGFLVAYNAGPGRWDDYRLRARPLPAETIAYLARLGPSVGGSSLSAPTLASSLAPQPPLAPPLFVRLVSTTATVPMSAERKRIVQIIDANTSVIRPASEIFVSRTHASQASKKTQTDGDLLVSGSSPGSSPMALSATPVPPRNPLFPDRTIDGSRQ